MARLLLVAVIGAVLWLLYKGFTRAFKGRGKSDAEADSSKSQDSAVEAMVPCSRCGVNLPKSEARLVNGAFECADSGQCAHRT